MNKICASSNTPGEKLYSWNVKSLNKSVELNNSILHLFTDPDFFAIYELDIVAGRSFDYDLLATDIADWSKQTTFIINEAAVRDLGLSSSEEALGLNLQSGLGNIRGEIIGVAKDFHYEGLQNSIAPLIMVWLPNRFKYLTMQINPSNTSSTLSGVQEKWYELYPDVVFESYFLSDIIDSQYNDEKLVNRIALIFALVRHNNCTGRFNWFFIFCAGKQKDGSRNKEASWSQHTGNFPVSVNRVYNYNHCGISYSLSSGIFIIPELVKYFCFQNRSRYFTFCSCIFSFTLSVLIAGWNESLPTGTFKYS